MRPYVTHLGVKYASALLARSQQQRQNRVLVRASKASDGADTHPLDHQVDDLRGFVQADRVGSKRIGVRLAKRRAAIVAAVALNPALAVGSEPLNCGVLASQTGHIRLYAWFFVRGTSPETGLDAWWRTSV